MPASHGSTTLQGAIYAKLSMGTHQIHVFISHIPTGMYAHYSRWIVKEIDGARLYRKPILAVDLRGSQRRSSIVGDASSLCVAWSSKSVVSGIWNLYYR